MAQADFAGIATSRYVRKLEKGEATPTLQMLESLSRELRISAAAFVALTLAETDTVTDTTILQDLIAELEALIKAEAGKIS